MVSLQTILDERLVALDGQIAIAEFERDHSATPMESHHDKSRQLAEQLIDALRIEKNEVVSLSNIIHNPKYQLVYLLSTPLREKSIMVVPNGLGGRTFDNITLVSDTSPLGQILANQAEGNSFELNGSEYILKSVHSNQ